MNTLKIKNKQYLADLDPDIFPIVDDFEIVLKDRGQFGLHLFFYSPTYGQMSSFPWWDHVDGDLRRMEDHHIPLGSINQPYCDVEQGWLIMIWQHHDFVYVAQGQDETVDVFQSWFRIPRKHYITAWQNAIASCRANGRRTCYSITEALQAPLEVTALILCNQGLSELSSQIEQFINLEFLDIHGNILQESPDEIGHLSKLRWLDLRFNQLQKLPQTIAHLYNLESINLAENNLRYIPDDIVHLQKLHVFFVPGNPLSQQTLHKFYRLRPDIEWTYP